MESTLYSQAVHNLEYRLLNQPIKIHIVPERYYKLFHLQERQQQVNNLAPVKTYISECLDKLQSAMTGTYNNNNNIQ